MGTQWNVGVNGATGLNYASLPFMFDLLGVKQEDKQTLFCDLQVMEYAALEQMAENQKDG